MNINEPEEPPYFLHHPLYLDTPMMVSFLAHLEGGVSTSEEATTTEAGSKERVLKARAGFKFNLPAILDADLGGEGSAQSRADASSEVKTSRHHTAASLFNALYRYLREDGQIMSVGGAPDIEKLSSGQLIELKGLYLGNPFEDVLLFADSLLGYLTAQQEAKTAGKLTASRANRSGNPQVKAAAAKTPTMEDEAVLDSGTAALVVKMAGDVRASHVHDLLLETTDGLSAVLTVSSDFYTSATNEYLKSGEFTVIGKVTRALDEDETINLSRRTILGAASPELAQSVVDGFSSMRPEGAAASAIVTGPVIQVLPMAIYI